MNKIYKLLFGAIIALPLFASHAVTVGQMAPDFTLKSFQGSNQRLAEQKGNIIVLNFWASWCGPCRKEMPALEQLQNKYKDLGVAVWGVNVEQESQAGREFITDIKVSFPIFFDETNTISKNYAVAAMPTTVIIDRDGKVRHIFKGYKTGYEKKYAKAIKKLLRE
ncbi:TlpA family protein disulfide reductase [Saccharobesus litoralis]|uniref:TlpA family protein disulfide reductase n=1 Tax=Saccharobesus litoralis TaxID=2172099 RepID=A0A2S0VT25_9ALTE|nr:TlpA disulfide reductase family protein [Saccharobesus litoralis]AWB67357.1 TlpA family protein disulfide reductase [Saccharobesus litoralis]